MTINVMESIKKMMGWCPNASALATKRVMVTLHEGDFFADEKGKGGMNPVKMGWGNRYRNIALLITLISFASLGFFMLFLLFMHGYSDFVEYLQNSLLKGIITGIILAVFISADQWRHLNRINEGKNVRPKFSHNFAVMTLLFAGFMFLFFTIKAYDFFLVVMFSTGFIFSLINYPMTIYWERKNRKTIYLIEERWRPVAMPGQAP
jgi:hypothetical protein